VRHPSIVLQKAPCRKRDETPSTTLSQKDMNKADLIEAVQNNLGGDTSKRAVGEAVDAVLGAIAKGVARHGTVQLIGFGTFKVAKRAARTGRNPKTGEAMKIKASKTVRFVPSAALKSSL
jgi:DNA-binding protein HU-beta